MVRTGAHVYLQYGIEGTFGGGATQTRVFGLEQKISGITWKNNQIPVTKLNDIEVQQYAYGKNEGSASVEWVMSNPWVFSTILGGVDTSGSSLNFTHLFSSNAAALTADNTGVKIPKSLAVEYAVESETANTVRTFLGSVITSFTLKAAINETVKGSAELIWGKEAAVGTSLDSTPASDDIAFPYTFAHASLELPDGSVVAQLQDFEITFNLNSELLYAIGTRDAVGAFRKIFEITGRFKSAVVDKTQLQRVIDASDGTVAGEGIATLQITLTNGLAGTSEKAIILDFSGVGVSEHSTESAPGEPVFQDLTFQMRRIAVTANNSVSAVP